jgi:multiple sugar transport system substrate-binding protein
MKAYPFITQNRAIILSLVTSILVLLLASCDAPATPPPDPVTISFGYVGFDNLASDRIFYTELAEKFSQVYPHITVEVGFDSLYSAFFEAETGNDVMLVPDFILQPLVAEEIILSINGLLEQNPDFPRDDFYPGTFDLFRYEDLYWGIPAGMDPFVIFYNRDLFDQYGVPYPGLDWTWNDFLIAAQSTRDLERNTFGYGSTTIFGPDSKFMESMVFIYQHGGQLFDDYEAPTHLVFDDPLAIETLQWYGDLYQALDIAPTSDQALEHFGGPVNISVYQGITNGQIAMWPGSFSNREAISNWPVSWDFSYGILPYPQDVNAFNLMGGSAYVILAETQETQAAWQWIQFLTEQPGLYTVSARKSIVESDPFRTQVGSENAIVIQHILENGAFFPTFYADNLDRDFSNFQTVLEKIVEQGEDAQTAMYWAHSLK